MGPRLELYCWREVEVAGAHITLDPSMRRRPRRSPSVAGRAPAVEEGDGQRWGRWRERARRLDEVEKAATGEHGFFPTRKPGDSGNKHW